MLNRVESSHFFYFFIRLSQSDDPGHGFGGLTWAVFMLFFNWFFLISSFNIGLVRD